MKKKFLIFYKGAFLCALLLISFIGCSFCFGQSRDSIRNLYDYSFKTEHGKLLTTNDYIKNLSSKVYSAYSFQVKKQTKGDELWERMYNNPSYGIAVNYVDFGHNKQMGEPYSIYGVFEQPIKKFGKFSWDYYVELGLSFNANPYNPKEDYLNVSFGSKTNLFMGVGSSVKYALGDYFDIGLGLAVNHFSDGSLKSPNKGLNFFGSQLMLVYHPKLEKTNQVIGYNGEKYDRFNVVDLSLFAGRKSVFYRGVNRSLLPSPYEGFDYNVYGLEFLYLKQYSFKSAVGFGLGMTYDGEYNRTMAVVDGGLRKERRYKNEHYLISLLPSYRLMIGDFFINVQLGYYPFKEKREFDDSKFFQKIALQYQFSPRFFASFGINAYDFHRANYLEWKLGYTLIKRKR